MNQITSYAEANYAAGLHTLHLKVRAALVLSEIPPIREVHPGQRAVTNRVLDLIAPLVPEITATGSLFLLDFLGVQAWRGSVELCEYRPRVGGNSSMILSRPLQKKINASAALQHARKNRTDATIDFGDFLYSSFQLHGWGFREPVADIILVTPWVSSGVKIKPSSLPVLTQRESLRLRGLVA